MTHSYTYTFTRYWTDESPGMEKLKDAFSEIELDFERRREFLNPRTVLAMEKRIQTLMNAWYFMLEEAPSHD